MSRASRFQIGSSGCLSIGVDDTENQSNCTACSAGISVLKAVGYPEEFYHATTIRLPRVFRRGNSTTPPSCLWLDGTGRRHRPALLRERGLESKRIGLAGSISYQVYNKLRETFPSASFVDLSGKLRQLRTVKSAEEIERIRIASKLTDQSIQAMAEGLKAGMREDE